MGARVIYRFADFTLDAVRREVRHAGALVAMEPQVFDVLAYLVAARDRVVSRDDLLRDVWHGRIVSEATLSSRLNAARTAIGDTGARQDFIRTLPRKGVRFIAPVQEAPDAAPEPADAAFSLRPASRLPALAVLPFANLSGDPGQDYVADGMSEEIITALSRVSGLFVIARNSSFAYRGAQADARRAARELGVGYVLEGSVRRSGPHLRITGQLIDAASGACIWADRFDGVWDQVFALQDRVAAGVAAAIEPTLQLAEIARLQHAPPPRPDAYDHLLRAYAHMADFTAAGMDAALECLAAALRADPACAPAMAATAYCRAQSHFQGWTRQDEPARAQALALAWRAVELAPGDAHILWMAAFAVWNMAQDGRDRARDLFRRSLLINPNSAMALTLAGWIETMCGNSAEGRDMVERARRLNPRDPRGWLISGVLALAAVIDGDHQAAQAWAEQALAQNRRFAVALRVLAVALVKQGQVPRARAVVQELLAIEPGLTVSAFLARIPVPLDSMAALYAETLPIAGLPA